MSGLYKRVACRMEVVVQRVIGCLPMRAERDGPGTQTSSATANTAC